MSIESRLDRLEKAPGGKPRPLTLFFSYGEAPPVPPPGCGPITLIEEVIVDRIEPDGTQHVQDPWDPDGPVIVVRPGELLPDRTPRGEGR